MFFSFLFSFFFLVSLFLFSLILVMQLHLESLLGYFCIMMLGIHGCTTIRAEAKRRETAA